MAWIHRMTSLPLVISVLVSLAVDGFPGGAPPERCESMTPGHGTESTDPNPYTLSLASANYTPGESLNVSLNGQNFQGILLQARKIGDTTAVGTFTPFSIYTEGLACQGNVNSAVTHSEPREKPAGTLFVWTAPNDLTEDIEFIATVAKDRFTWWKNTKSTVIRSSVSNGVNCVTGDIIAVLMATVTLLLGGRL